jgi:signal transduction histidine kinase
MGDGDVAEQVKKRIEYLRLGRPYRVIRSHGDSVIEIKGNPIPTGGYVTTYDDISEFILTQDRLEKTMETLEQRVAERTEELELAQKEAEHANRTKSQFLAQASHDILQPLNAASLYASVLLEQEKKNNLGNVETIQNLYEVIQSSEGIISTFLEISKLDTGAIVPDVKPVRLNDVLKPLVNEFKVQLSESAELRYVLSSLRVDTDQRYLRRIVQNFLSNAIKYTQKGKIVLGCRRRSEYAEIFVLDSGPGIPEPELDRIFEDFYRASNLGDVQGIGLGLAVAQRFSDLLSHKIRYASRLNVGSSFSILVPISEQADEA